MEELDLGDRYESPGESVELHVRNTGTDPVTVSDVMSNCDCLAVVPRTFTVPAGGTQSLTVTVALSVRSECQRYSAAADVVTIPLRMSTTTRGVPGPIDYALTARVKAPVRPSPGRQSLGLVAIPDGAFEFWSVVELAPAVNGVVAQCPPGWTARVPAAPPGGGPVTAYFAKNAPVLPGAFDVSFSLTGRDATGRSLPASDLHLNGEFVPPVIALPRSVLFGRVAGGTVCEDHIRLQSVDGRPFRVTGIRPDPGVTVTPSETGEYAVRAVVPAGSFQAAVAFEVTFDDGRSATCRVPASAFGFEKGAGP